MHGSDHASSQWNADYRAKFPYQRVALLASFLGLCILAETVRKDGEQQSQASQDVVDFATSDLFKSILSLSIWFVWRKVEGRYSYTAITVHTARDSPEASLPTGNAQLAEDRQLFPSSRRSLGHREQHPRSSLATLSIGSVRSTLSILVVSLVYTFRAYIELGTREFADAFALYLASPVTILCILVILWIIAWRNFPSAFWHASVLHFAGVLVTRESFLGPVIPPYILVIALSLCNSLWATLVELIYGLHNSSSAHLINSISFLQSFLLHFLLHLWHSPLHSNFINFTPVLRVLPLIEAIRDIAAMLIIHQHGAIAQGILIAFVSSLLITLDIWAAVDIPLTALLGCLIVIVASITLTFHMGKQTDDPQRDLLASARRLLTLVATSSLALGYLTIILQSPGTVSSDLSPFWRMEPVVPSRRPGCRAPTISTSTHADNTYTRFSNILLIVFFSHPRYDANLDFHKEVYADYFPNIVYIGPASREDKGFDHSYDVLVDSFQSDEDLSDPLFYKMSGRMAHHMLYTALREYDCYDGYLWVPFDTLLNIPRLQQFNQSLFWYHSPWGQPISNLALGNLTEHTLNRTRHAPPAIISPDPSINLTETWRGWGLDWWWGDPHVGVSVCMEAFRKVPEDMRSHLAELTDNQTRLIGGSADTLYIPGRHRKTFMDVLSLFLETNCFLEIATPTTVHLVVPPGEPIQFVDHWWIYQPPFNASFVRQKWAEGYEVDTFHTFHWGDRGEDGIWRGDHYHVADVRRLLQESAERQDMGLDFPVYFDQR